MSTEHRIRRLEEAAARQLPPQDEPTVRIYLPHNGRGEPGPGRYRSGAAELVIYDPHQEPPS